MAQVIWTRTGQPSTPLQGDTYADTQCPGTMVSARMTGVSSCLGTLVRIVGVPSCSMQILCWQPECCLRELVQITRSPRRIHAADGTVLGTPSADNHGQLQLRLERALGVASAEGNCAGTSIAVQAPCGRGLCECPDALWAPVLITGVSNCLTKVLCG